MPNAYTTAAIAIYIALFVGGCSSDRAADYQRTAAGTENYMQPALEHDSEALSQLPELDENSTLSDYLTYAALNNPGLKAAFNRWKAALEKATVQGALPDPKFNYAYYIENVETRVGPQKQKFGLSQLFPWFGKLDLREGIALENANAAKERYEAEKLKLFYDVKRTYYEYYYLMRAISITRDNVELVKYLEKVARIRYATAGATNTDVIRAQVELGKLDDRMRTLIDLKQPTIAELNAALNRPGAAPVAAPAKIEEATVAVSDEELLQWFRQANPELKALAFEVDAGKKAVKLAGKNYYPDFTFGLDYIETDPALMAVDDNGKDPVAARIMINLPIWYGKYRAQQEQARRQLSGAKNRLADSENILASKIALVLYRLHDANRKIDLYRDTLVPLGEQSLKATETAYTTGEVSFSDLIDAQRILLEFELSYERALASHAQKLAQLNMLAGREIPTVNDN